jgi:hypothetical protein
MKKKIIYKMKKNLETDIHLSHRECFIENFHVKSRK